MRKHIFLYLVCMLLSLSTWAQQERKETIGQPRLERLHHSNRLHHMPARSMKTTKPLERQVADGMGLPHSARTMNKVQTDSHGVITERPAGELRRYNRTGQRFYRTSGYDLKLGETVGQINIVFADDNQHVYLQGPVSGLDADNWVEGTIDGNTITVPLGQKTNYYTEYNSTTELRFLWTNYDEAEEVLSFGIDDDEVATFVINSDGTIALQNSSQEHILAIIWSDNNDWSGYGEFESVYVPEGNGMSVPYEQTFFNEQDFNAMTIIDGNNDSKTWKYYYPVAMYEYSYSKDADDWLITPGIYLKAGMKYRFMMDVAESSEEYGPERIEVRMGAEPMTSAFNTIIVPPTELTLADFVTLSNDAFSVAADGIYYFGVHAISDVYRECIFLRSINVEEAISERSPASVSNLTVTPDPAGYQKATITFNAPTLSLLNTPLSPVDLKARIYRDGEPIGTVEMTPGQRGVMFHDDDVPYFGFITYSVVTYSGSSRGGKAEAEAYIGADYPLPVEEFNITDSDNGLKFTWSPVPTEGAWGGPVNPETVGYDIHKMSYNDNDGAYYISSQLNTETIFGTSYIYEPYPEANLGPQGFHYYAVIPVSTITGKDEYTYTIGEVLEGAPDTLPYRESVTGHRLSHFLTWSGSGNGVYLYYSDQSSDDDGEAMKLESEFAHVTGCLETGKIALGDAKDPTLVFDAFSNADGNKMQIIAVTPDGERHVLKTVLPGSHFRTYTASLKEFAGQRWVRIFCEVYFNNASYVNIDDIRISDYHAHDLALTFEAPADVVAGQKAPLKLTVTNLGQQASEPFAVQVLAGDKIVYTKEVYDALGFYDTMDFDVAWQPSIFTETGDVKLSANIITDSDDDFDNNVAESTITILEPVASTPEELTYTYDDGVVTLSWVAPSVTVSQVTDDFETYQPWTTADNVGPWTLVDRDKASTIRLFSDVPLPVEGKAMAFTVWNYDGQNVVEGHNSRQCLAALMGKTADGKYAAPDDWIISPQLVGKAQTISFWAWGRKYYNEKFNVLYSTTDNSPESFTAVNETPYVANSGEWEKISVALPEGAKYFAIQRQQTSGGATWLLGIDDITYTMLGDNAVAFNLYVNGMKSATLPASQLSLTMEHLSRNTHEIALTAVYADGLESRPVKVNVPVYKTTPILPPSGGETKTMYLKGIDHVMETPMAQQLSVVFFPDKVYLQGMRRSSPESWVVGDITGNKVTFNPWHTIGTKLYQNQEVGIFMEGLQPETSELGPLVMTIDPYTKEMRPEGQYILFNASMSSVLFDQIVKDPVITAFNDDKPELVTPPSDLATTPGNVVTSLYYDHKQASWSGEIGFDGDDCYFRGSFYYLPEAWIKGHVDGLRITFPANQFMGDCSGFDSYMNGLYFDHSNGQMAFADFVLVWNPETNCYEGENALAFSASRDYFAGIEIEENVRFYTLTPPPSGISDIAADTPSSHTRYTVTGQRLSPRSAVKGIVIEGGRKVLK